jgi:Raf kinase inhibitor-like YbhB/YbcL family protein
MRFLSAAVAILACVTCAPLWAEQGGIAMPFSFSSTSFPAGGKIPAAFTADGRDSSPALAWENPPAGTVAFALVCDDPDAPVGTWVHWVIWNVPGTAKGLPEGVKAVKTLADGSAQGKNDFGRIGYGGPSPPPGKPHRYFFRLFALREKLPLPAGSSRKELEKAMQGKVVGSAELVGTYGR